MATGKLGTLVMVNQETGSEHEIAVVSLNVVPTEDVKNTVGIKTGLQAEISVKMKVNRLTLLSLALGRKVTNNWLKMHGGVMVRRW